RVRLGLGLGRARVGRGTSAALREGPERDEAEGSQCGGDRADHVNLLGKAGRTHPTGRWLVRASHVPPKPGKISPKKKEAMAELRQGLHTARPIAASNEATSLEPLRGPRSFRPSSRPLRPSSPSCLPSSRPSFPP